MEMESSRRPPFDSRSRELSIKRQRLAEEPPNIGSRPFQPQRPVNSSSAASSRLRTNDRDRDRDSDDSGRGPYQQQSPHQDLELLTRYKDALSDLTFNSKPIITNLTIIAGEASPAAKAAIASLICGNILEVPSYQKLPSLYLLDSIVKNIGKEYIKHFAPKLPEVFIKAYRQVDRSVHQSMKHLFGTWKGVFPLQPLQLIEKELGLPPSVNGSSSGLTVSRSESQSQRQPHGIHVNPKYLEARQRLQQSSRPKILPDDVGGTFDDATEDTERPGRKVVSVGAAGLWGDASIKMHNSQRPQREEPRDSLLEKVPKAESEDYEYISGISRQLSSRLGKVNEKIKEPAFDRQWLGSVTEMEEPITSQRNGYDSKRSVANYSSSRLGNFNMPSKQKVPSGSSGDVSRSWKNSEEEEFSWDELNPIAGPAMSMEDLDNLEHRRQSQSEVGIGNEREPMSDAYLAEQREHISLGPRRSSPWPLQDRTWARSSTVPLSKSGFQSHMDPAQPTVIAASGSSGLIGQRQPSSRKPLTQQHPPPSFSARDPRLLFAEKDHIQSNVAPANRKLTSPLDRRSREDTFQDSAPVLNSRLPSDKLKRLEPQTSRKPTPATSFKPRKSAPISPKLPSSHLETDSQVLPDASSLLASVMKSGILSSLGSALSTGPPSTSHDELRLPSTSFASGDPPSSLPSSAGSQGVTGMSTSSDPFSSLLSTLVAKGLIGTSNSESGPAIPPLSSEQPHNAMPVPAATAAAAVAKVEVPKVSKSPTIGMLSAKSPVHIPKTEPQLKSKEPQLKSKEPQLKSKEIESLIGYEFRSDVLREFHPIVVDRLFDKLPYSCSICGLRLKLKERFERHMEWHAFKESEQHNMSSRRWYSSDKDWIAGKGGLPICCSPNASFPESCSDNTSVEQFEPMVPADESQCVCLVCGDLFEDFYSQEEDKWMFKRAIYMKIASENHGKERSASQVSEKGLIVHEKCLSDERANDLRLASWVKLENDV